MAAGPKYENGDQGQGKRTRAALRNVQQAFRHLKSGAPTSDWAATRVLPEESGRRETVFLTRDCADALSSAVRAISIDLSYEWLSHSDEAVWLLATRCYLDKRNDQVARWVSEHAREPELRTCYLPIERLEVSEEQTVLGHLFLPLDDPRVPTSLRERLPRRDVRSVLAVDVRGTNPARMAQRAQEIGQRVLRVLRFSLREHRSIADRQLLFRLGVSYAFDDQGLEGWSRRLEDGFHLGMGPVLAEFVEKTDMADLLWPPQDDLSRRFDAALRWLERSSFASEPMPALLYAFFALEAILGDKAEKLKAHVLAFRQAMLSIEADGSFRHPDHTWRLYDEVRSSAVHGETPPEVTWKQVDRFRWTVRRSVLEVRTTVQEHGFRRRSALTRFLDEHPQREEFELWLRAQAGRHWLKWLDGKEPAPP